ncbi:MAG: tRNA-guanine transglycosylase [Rhodospirillaceae bacterium]|nr:tRNA-guanine transglycosylase [Rhodospirillaceae bacterium]|tara:strand:+ start:2431 stop:3516 length:1086 start_codon:yes stop_codon:yes gene_type:complete
MMTLKTRRSHLQLPAFLPDGTRAVVKGLDAQDLADCGIEAMMVNSLHLATRPGTSTVKALGGVHRFMGWKGVTASDSGGFQAWSMAQGNGALGSVTDKGFVYRHEKGGKKHLLTPEKCIRRQLELDTDILFCLDQCTHPDDSAEVQRLSVERTLDWARRCRDEFVARVGEPGDGDGSARPLLFAVVQGGNDPDLRRRCADELAAMGFDGFGFGGWPIDDDGLLTDMVALTADCLPQDSVKHALGIGKPENLMAAWRAGYRLFDCALPTRNARRKRLYMISDTHSIYLKNNIFYDHLYLENEQHSRDQAPIDAVLDPEGPSRAYLHHLFKIKDSAAERLATRHNLKFYAWMIDQLRVEAVDD